MSLFDSQKFCSFLKWVPDTHSASLAMLYVAMSCANRAAKYLCKFLQSVLDKNELNIIYTFFELKYYKRISSFPLSAKDLENRTKFGNLFMAVCRSERALFLVDDLHNQPVLFDTHKYCYNSNRCGWLKSRVLLPYGNPLTRFFNKF